MDLTEHPNMPTGTLEMSVYRSGVLVEKIVEKNLIVDAAKALLAHLLGGDTVGKFVSKIGFGTNGAAPNVGNTGLTGAFVKATGAVTYPAANQVRFAFTLLTSEANGLSIIEFGLFSGDDTLFSRRVRGSAILKDNTISFSGTWTISF